MTAREWLDQVQQRADSATEGPWRDEMMGSEGSIVLAGGVTIRTARRIARTPEFADAEFIAAARTDIPRLVAALRAVLDLADGIGSVDNELAHRSTIVRHLRAAITDRLTNGEPR